MSRDDDLDWEMMTDDFSPVLFLRVQVQVLGV